MLAPVLVLVPPPLLLAPPQSAVGVVGVIVVAGASVVGTAVAVSMVYMVSMVVVSVESGSEVVGAEVVGTELGGWVGGVQAGGGVTGAVVVGGGVGGGHVGGIGGGVGQVEQLSSTEFPVLHPVHSRHCPATYIVAGTVEIVAELPIWALAVGVAQAVPLGVWPGVARAVDGVAASILAAVLRVGTVPARVLDGEAVRRQSATFGGSDGTTATTVVDGVALHAANNP